MRGGFRKRWKENMGQSRTILGEKVREALASVLPITVIVLLLCFTVAPVSTDILLAFLMGAVLLIAGMGLFTLLRCPSPMIRTQREKGVGRVMRSALGCMVLLGMAALGDVVFLVVGGQALQELPGFALLVCCAVIGAGCFFRVKAAYNGMKTVPAPQGGHNP